MASNLPPRAFEIVPIEEEMKRSYLDYAMSVIVSRALARRARRPQAGAAAHPLRHARRRLRFRPAAPQVGAHRRRRDGQVPSARRHRDLRRAGPHGAGLLHAPAADRRAGQLRLDGRRSAGGHALHRERGWPRSPTRCSPTSTRTRSTSGRTTTRAARSRRSCRRSSRTCWSTAPAASRSAWRPTSRRTTWARSSTPRWR